MRRKATVFLSIFVTMNYLAHIYFSYNDPDILVGNFAADFISNKQVKLLTDQQVNGVLLHRLIDAYTDVNETVRKSTKRLRTVQGKYAPVVIDIIFDYILAKEWERFHPEGLEVYKQNAYELLLNHLDGFPERARGKVQGMANGDFIRSYESLDGLHYVFERMDKRTKFPSRFRDATEQLRLEEDQFVEDFLLFFPQIKSKVQAFLKGLEVRNTYT